MNAIQGKIFPRGSIPPAFVPRSLPSARLLTEVTNDNSREAAGCAQSQIKIQNSLIFDFMV